MAAQLQKVIFDLKVCDMVVHSKIKTENSLWLVHGEDDEKEVQEGGERKKSGGGACEKG